MEIRLAGKPTRTGDKRDRGVELSARIHTWEMTNELDTRGNYVLKNHTLVTLNFSGVVELKLEGFNHQNVIFGLMIQPKESSEAASSEFHVEFDPSFGVDAIFDCSAIEVIEATALPNSIPEE
jgi:hypothetical protein